MSFPDEDKMVQKQIDSEPISLAPEVEQRLRARNLQETIQADHAAVRHAALVRAETLAADGYYREDLIEYTGEYQQGYLDGRRDAAKSVRKGMEQGALAVAGRRAGKPEIIVRPDADRASFTATWCYVSRDGSLRESAFQCTGGSEYGALSNMATSLLTGKAGTFYADEVQRGLETIGAAIGKLNTDEYVTGGEGHND